MTETTEQETNDAVASPAERLVRRGQVFTTKDHGRVRFDRLDFYMGECTAKLTGIDYPGTYYPSLERMDKEGITFIDA